MDGGCELEGEHPSPRFDAKLRSMYNSHYDASVIERDLTTIKTSYPIAPSTDGATTMMHILAKGYEFLSSADIDEISEISDGSYSSEDGGGGIIEASSYLSGCQPTPSRAGGASLPSPCSLFPPVVSGYAVEPSFLPTTHGEPATPSRYGGYGLDPGLLPDTHGASIILVVGDGSDSSSSDSSDDDEDDSYSAKLHPLPPDLDLEGDSMCTSMERLMKELASHPTVDSMWKLHRYEADFYYAAQTYARVIISELELPVERKTIKPVDVGGIAGGAKYVHGGILFKVPRDVEVAPGLWMYGGTERCDAYARKAAGGEILAYNNIQGLLGLIYCPSMAMVDYLGVRVVAMAIAPVKGSSTLVYGSSDGGNHVVASDEEACAKMGVLGRILGLAEHAVGDKRLVGPGDIEVHRGTDGELWLLDIARLFPPEAPALCSFEKEVFENCQSRLVFFRHLRPELLRRTASKGLYLSSDVYTGWGASDPDKALHEQRNLHVTTWLREFVVPEVAQKLMENSRYVRLAAVAQRCASIGVANSNRLDGSGSGPWQDMLLLVQKLDLAATIHAAGCNLRHLGRIRRCLLGVNDALAALLLSYACARAIKSIVNYELRSVRKGDQIDGVLAPKVQQYKEVICRYVNMVSAPRRSIHSVASGSAAFWTSRLVLRLREMYAGIFSEEELKSIADGSVVVDLMYHKLMMLFLLPMLGVQLRDDALRDISLGQPLHCISYDIVVLPVQRSSFRIDFFAAAASYLEALRGLEDLRKEHIDSPLRSELRSTSLEKLRVALRGFTECVNFFHTAFTQHLTGKVCIELGLALARDDNCSLEEVSRLLHEGSLRLRDTVQLVVHRPNLFRYYSKCYVTGVNAILAFLAKTGDRGVEPGEQVDRAFRHSLSRSSTVPMLHRGGREGARGRRRAQSSSDILWSRTSLHNEAMEDLKTWADAQSTYHNVQHNAKKQGEATIYYNLFFEKFLQAWAAKTTTTLWLPFTDELAPL